MDSWFNQKRRGRPRKLTADQVRQIRRRAREGDRAQDMAIDYHCSTELVHKVIRRKLYLDVEDE